MKSGTPIASEKRKKKRKTKNERLVQYNKNNIVIKQLLQIAMEMQASAT